MTPLQVYSHGNLVGCNLERQFVVGPAFGGRRVCGLDRLDVNRCLGEKFQSNCVAGIVARSEKLELEDERHGEMSAAGLAVSLLAAVLTSCPPAWGANLSLNSANAIEASTTVIGLGRCNHGRQLFGVYQGVCSDEVMWVLKVRGGFDRCSLRGVQANGYEYAYPKSWVRDRIRGIEVLAHDPEVGELNMSIFTSPAQSGTLSGSAAEVGETIIAQYKKSPTIDKAELLGVDLKQDGGYNRSYSVELSIEAGGKQRHLLTKLIKTDRKVLSLTLQVPEELWPSNESCMKSITENFKQTTLV